MKKLLFLSVIASLALHSCKKTETPQAQEEPSQKKYHVNFSVNSFSQEIVSSGKGATISAGPLSNSIKRIEYLLYNSEGIRINQRFQYADHLSFGKLTDSLAGGEYTAYFIGDQNSGLIYRYDDTQNGPVISMYQNIEDVFAKKISFTVKDSTIEQAIVLDRIVSQLQVQLTDEIPASVTKIEVIANTDAGSYDLKQNKFWGGSQRKVPFSIGADQRGKKDVKLTTLVANTSAPQNIVLVAYSASGGIVAERTIKNVLFEKNKKTVLTGKLFTEQGGGNLSFSVTANSEWSTDVNKVNF